MTHERAVEILGTLVGPRLQREKTGLRDTKALLLVAGRESWDAAAALADALGVHPDDQEAVYFTLQREKANA